MLRHLLRTVNLFDTAKSALFLCLLAACHSESGGRAEGRGLVYYETYDPRSLDPALSTDVPTGEMVALAYDGLTQFDPDGKLLPALADRWTISRGGGGGGGAGEHPRGGGRGGGGGGRGQSPVRVPPAGGRQVP